MGGNNPATMSVFQKTIPATVKISKHFYKTICLSLQGEAASTMDCYTETHRGRRIEYYHQLKRMFHPLWPVSDYSTKLINFYQLFRRAKTSVDMYAATFKRWVLEMKYNGISFDSNRFCLQFINGLRKEFTQLRNMHTLPPEWQTTDITLLTHTARTYLSTIEVNYEMNWSQSAYLKAASAELPLENPPENSPGRPRQHPRQQTPGTPNPPSPDTVFPDYSTSCPRNSPYGKWQRGHEDR